MSANNGLDFKTGLVQMMIKVEETHLKMPLSLICGSKPGPTILITTGLHGGEYPGTLAAVELMREIKPEEFSGRLMAIHPVNTMGFKARMATIMPEDGGDLNSSFPGGPYGGASEKIAWKVGQFQQMADFYLDLHSGELHEELCPHVYYSKAEQLDVVASSRMAAQVLNMAYIVKSDNPGAAICAATANGIPSLLLARGCAGACNRDDVDRYKIDIINILKHLGNIEGEPEKLASTPVELERVTYLKSKQTGMWVSNVSAGQKVAAGQSLGRITDFFGDVLQEYEAERDGVVLYRLNTLAANSNDVLVAY